MKIIFKWTLNLILLNFQLIFHMFWRSHLSSLMKMIELLKVSEFEIVPNGIQIFSKPVFIYLNGRSHIIFTLGFCDEMNLNSWRSEMQGESLGKSFHSLSFNFQKVSNVTQFHSGNHTTIKPSIKTIYLIYHSKI